MQPEVGSKAPDFEIENALYSLSSDDLRGKYVVVDFWSASNPESRVKSALHSRQANGLTPGSIVCISVCIDADTRLADQIAKVDRMPDNDRFFASHHTNARMVKAFKAENGNVSYLISPDGVIMAKNDFDLVKEF